MSTTFTRTDFLYVLLFITIAAGCLSNIHSPFTAEALHKSAACALIYMFSRVLFTSRYRSYSETVIIAAIALVCLQQDIYGLKQISGRSFSNNALAYCTGSFMNPGPYGGFLSVSATILSVWVLNNTRSANRLRHKPAGQDFRQTGAAFLYHTAYLLISAVTAFTLLIIPATMSRAAILAFAIGLTGRLLASPQIHRNVRRQFTCSRKRSVAITLVVACLSAVVAIASYRMKSGSADGRVFMAKISLMAIADKPVCGAGPGMSLKAYGDAQYHYFKTCKYSERERMTADSPEYSFNTFLTTGIEYGIPAMILLMLSVAGSVKRSVRLQSPLGYGMIALIVFSIFSYPHALTPFIIMMPVLAASGCDEKEHSPTGRYVLTAISVSLLSLSYTSGKKLSGRNDAEKEWREYGHLYQSDHFDDVAERYKALLPYMTDNAQFLFQYGRSLLKTGEYQESIRILQAGADISCDPMFWNLLGSNMQAMGKYYEAEQCYKRSFSTVPNRIYPLHLLSLLYYETGDTARFIETSEYIRTFKPKIESDAVRKLRNITEQYEQGINQKSKPTAR